MSTADVADAGMRMAVGISSASSGTLDAPLVELIPQTICRRAAEDGHQTAFTFLEGRGSRASSMTYSELHSRVAALAGVIGQHTGPKEPVACVLEPGLDFVTCFFACLFAGRIAVPVEPARGTGAGSRLSDILAHSGVRFCLVNAKTRDAVELVAATRGVDVLVFDVASVSLDGAPPDPAPITAADVAYLQYTSGSTGSPKGVITTHGAIAANSEAIRDAFGHTRSSVGVIWLPPYHDMGLIGGVVQPLYVGFPVYLMSPVEFVRSPMAWLTAISRYRGTTSGGPNFAYDQCVTRIAPEKLSELDLSSWTVAFTGAEPVSSSTIDRFSAVFGPVGFSRTAFTACYGLAESTLMVTCADHAAGPRLRPSVNDEGAVRHVSCGRPRGASRVLIVDPQTRRIAPDGEKGEVWVAGPSVSPGYWKDSSGTRTTFKGRLAGNDAGRFLRTGDIGFLVDGELYIVGRLKSLIIVRGVNRSFEELEILASSAHPLLAGRRCAAFAIGDEPDAQLVLMQEAPAAARAGELAVELVKAIRERIATTCGIQPFDVRLVASSDLPKTRSGKLQRETARQNYLVSG